jgi:hypothetical protein
LLSTEGEIGLDIAVRFTGENDGEHADDHLDALWQAYWDDDLRQFDQVDSQVASENDEVAIADVEGVIGFVALPCDSRGLAIRLDLDHYKVCEDGAAWVGIGSRMGCVRLGVAHTDDGDLQRSEHEQETNQVAARPNFSLRCDDRSAAADERRLASLTGEGTSYARIAVR